jgi:DNA-binding transcriptional ArsR family regulator
VGANRRDPFDAMGNPHRRAILELLAKKPQSVQEIADQLPISRPAVSRHLRLLNDAGLVTDEPIGNRRVYRLDDQGAAAARKYLTELWGDVGTRFRFFAENTKPKRARR